MNNKPEILAPAGTWEAFEAAIKAGADAVYLGGSLFSARAFAGNFDTETLIRAIDYSHFYDAKLYLALNTLLKPDEIGMVVDFVRPFYENGLDGIIVQDFGVINELSKAFPDLHLHASTQMSISSHYGAQLMKDMGLTRVVPARELSLDEIKSIKNNVDIEIESFIHGAMCYAYSGRCLFSSYLGGRSGNRGRCAQPCRQMYESEADSNYAMSLKDMCSLENVPALVDAGIDSFKIEGRMKKPEYVASTVNAYRRAVDMYKDGSWDIKEIHILKDNMMDIYNRGGFSAGYYFMHDGQSMISPDRPNHTGLKVGTVAKVAPPKVYVKLSKDVSPDDVFEIRGQERKGVELTGTMNLKSGDILVLNGREFAKIKPGMNVFRTRNNKLIEEIRNEIIDPEKQINAEAFVMVKVGEPLTIVISDEINENEFAGRELITSVSVTGAVIEKAQSRPTSAEDIVSKMEKTGGTGLKLNVTCDIDEDAFVQMKELNNLRRQAMELYKNERSAKYHR